MNRHHSPISQKRQPRLRGVDVLWAGSWWENRSCPDYTGKGVPAGGSNSRCKDQLEPRDPVLLCLWPLICCATLGIIASLGVHSPPHPYLPHADYFPFCKSARNCSSFLTIDYDSCWPYSTQCCLTNMPKGHRWSFLEDLLKRICPPNSFVPLGP